MLVSIAAVMVLALAPGAVLAVAATPAHSRLRRVALAASPSVTYGVVGAAVGWSTLLGRSWPPLGILGVEAALIVAACLLRLLAGRLGVAPGAQIKVLGLRDRLRAHRNDIAALGASVAVTMLVGWLALGGLGSPPGWDSMNHAFMARRVIDVGSALPGDVCVTGSVAPADACAFYPLAPHVVWAQAVELTGHRLSTVMLATTMVVMPVIATVGVFAVVRVCGGGSVLSACAAFLPTIVGPMWPSLVTGRLTILLGAALAPSAALLFWMAMRSPRARALATVASLGMGGVMLVHTYDVIVAGLLGLGLLITRAPKQRLRTWVLRTAGVGFGALTVVAPQAPGLLAASAERVVYPPARSGEFWMAVDHWLFTPGQYLATVVAEAIPGAELSGPTIVGHGVILSWLVSLGCLAGMAASFHPRFRWARPFAVVQALVLVIVVWIDVGTDPIRQAIASLFYGDPRRPMWSSVLAPAVLCLAGWTATFRVLGKGLARLPQLAAPIRSVRLRFPGWVVPLSVTAALVAGAAWVPDTWLTRERLAARAMPNDPAYQRVGAWLHARGGGVIADDVHRDFVTWINADDGLPVLRGMVPLAGKGKADWADRTRVWNALVWTRPGRGSCLPDRYDVRWVVVGTRHMPGGHRTYRPDRLANSPYLHLAHVDGPLWVYAVDHLCGTGT
jgi:hypothetical protein